jgi:hypothetical protein
VRHHGLSSLLIPEHTASRPEFWGARIWVPAAGRAFSDPAGMQNLRQRASSNVRTSGAYMQMPNLSAYPGLVRDRSVMFSENPNVSSQGET